MFIDWNAVKFFVRPGVTDLRKQTDGLAVMVQGELKQDPFSGNLNIYCARNRKLLKLLYWDRNGFSMLQKRLEGGSISLAPERRVGAGDYAGADEDAACDTSSVVV